MIQGIDFFSYATNDMPRAVAFYEQTLGLTKTSAYEDKWTEFDIGGSTLAVIRPEAFGMPYANGGGSAVAVRVADVPAAAEALRAKGVKVSEMTDTSVCHMVFLQDPDGNNLILHNRYAPEHHGQG
jgi:predicted enzyme related to lactoylglutathione lyase